MKEQLLQFLILLLTIPSLWFTLCLMTPLNFSDNYKAYFDFLSLSLLSFLLWFKWESFSMFSLRHLQPWIEIHPLLVLRTERCKVSHSNESLAVCVQGSLLLYWFWERYDDSAERRLTVIWWGVKWACVSLMTL